MCSKRMMSGAVFLTNDFRECFHFSMMWHPPPTPHWSDNQHTLKIYQWKQSTQNTDPAESHFNTVIPNTKIPSSYSIFVISIHSWHAHIANGKFRVYFVISAIWLNPFSDLTVLSLEEAAEDFPGTRLKVWKVPQCAEHVKAGPSSSRVVSVFKEIYDINLIKFVTRGIKEVWH